MREANNSKLVISSHSARIRTQAHGTQHILSILFAPALYTDVTSQPTLCHLIISGGDRRETAIDLDTDGSPRVFPLHPVRPRWATVWIYLSVASPRFIQRCSFLERGSPDLDRLSCPVRSAGVAILVGAPPTGDSGRV